MFNALKKYKEAHRHLNVPESYVDSSGKCLRRWMFEQRWLYNCEYGDPPARKLAEDRIQLLYDLGFDFTLDLKSKVYHSGEKAYRQGSKETRPADDKSREYQSDRKWNDRFAELVLWLGEHGHYRMPRNQKYMGKGLGEFKHITGKTKYTAGSRMDPDRILKLEAISFPFYKGIEYKRQWETNFEGLVLFKRLNGHVDVPKGYIYG